MRTVFADTHYWLAIVNPRDSSAEAARAARAKLGRIRLVTPDEVLTEFLAAVSGAGADVRVRVAKVVRAILQNPEVHVVESSRAGFSAALHRYEARPEYRREDLKGGVRGKYLGRHRKGTNPALLAPDVRAAFPTDEAVNEALRSLLRSA